MSAKAGDVVAGHRLVARLGGGHFGEVWKADYLGQAVALKILTGRRLAAGARREALAQYALGRLPGEDRRFFPRVDHVALDADPPHLRMELIEGRPLDEARPAALEARLALGRRILEALAAVHRNGFVHGDLSPLNVMVTPAGDVKLIDVGYGALFADTETDLRISSTAEESEEVLGVASPLYAAPERFTSKFLEGCGRPADVFAFAKVLYGLLTGEQPFVIKPLSMKHPSLGTFWDDFLFRCLEEKPEARFPDAAAALERYDALHRTEAPKAAEPDIEFIEGDDVLEIDDTPDPPPPAPARAIKFCPRCGRGILIEARKCRHCRAWVDDLARKLGPS